MNVNSNVGRTDPWNNLICNIESMDQTSTRQTPGSILRRLRNERGFTQTFVADAVGIARTTLSGIEKDKKYGAAGRATAIALADFYGVSFDKIYRVDAGIESGELVKDPDELALLAFWRSVDETEQKVLLRLMVGKRNGGD